MAPLGAHSALHSRSEVHVCDTAAVCPAVLSLSHTHCSEQLKTLSLIRVHKAAAKWQDLCRGAPGWWRGGCAGGEMRYKQTKAPVPGLARRCHVVSLGCESQHCEQHQLPMHAQVMRLHNSLERGTTTCEAGWRRHDTALLGATYITAMLLSAVRREQTRVTQDLGQDPWQCRRLQLGTLPERLLTGVGTIASGPIASACAD